MKLAVDNLRFESTAVGETHQFQIKASHKAFKILSDQLYQHKELAIVRELVANAWDAHVVAGTQDVPIDLHFPTSLEPWFAIRDYGTGLSHDDILQLYTTYFASDKTETNDLIGGLGLGSKSPFAYCDQFSVDSYHGGMRRSYAVYIGSDGVPQVQLIGEQPTSEYSGLFVQVPANVGDISRFHDAYYQVAPFIPTAPNTNLAIDIPKAHVSLAIGTSDFRAKAEVHSASDMKCATASFYVVQGIVRYEVPVSVIDIPPYYAYRICVGLHIHVPIGTFDVAASRETLSLDPDSIARLKTLYSEARTAVANHLVASIHSAATLADSANQVFDLQSSGFRQNQAFILDSIERCVETLQTELERKLESHPEVVTNTKLFALNTDSSIRPVIKEHSLYRGFFKKAHELWLRPAYVAPHPMPFMRHVQKMMASDSQAHAIVFRCPLDKVQAMYKDLGLPLSLVRSVPPPDKNTRAQRAAPTPKANREYSALWSHPKTADEWAKWAKENGAQLLVCHEKLSESCRRALDCARNNKLFTQPIEVVFIPATYTAVTKKLTSLVLSEPSLEQLIETLAPYISKDALTNIFAYALGREEVCRRFTVPSYMHRGRFVTAVPELATLHATAPSVLFGASVDYPTYSTLAEFGSYFWPGYSRDFRSVPEVLAAIKRMNDEAAEWWESFVVVKERFEEYQEAFEFLSLQAHAKCAPQLIKLIQDACKGAQT